LGHAIFHHHPSSVVCGSSHNSARNSWTNSNSEERKSRLTRGECRVSKVSSSFESVSSQKSEVFQRAGWDSHDPARTRVRIGLPQPLVEMKSAPQLDEHVAQSLPSIWAWFIV
jgi:hypothetical protein